MPRFPRRYWLISRAIGLLLLAAAVLKVAGLRLAAVGPIGIFSSPAFQLGVVCFELCVGLCLLFGRHAIGSWLACLAAFFAFAAVNFYLGWIGEARCGGCFGRLSANFSPWFAFALDVLILASLFFGRPELKPLCDNPRRSLAGAMVPAAWNLVGIAVLAGLLLAVAHFGFGSVNAALAYFRGDRLSIEPGLIDVGPGIAGEMRQVSLTLTNWTDEPIQLFGGTDDCLCTVLHDLPVIIPGKESRSVSVRLRLPGSSGIFTSRATFLINDQGFKSIHFRITGRVTATSIQSFHQGNKFNFSLVHAGQA